MDLKSMTLIEMQEYMESIGEKKFRAKQVYEWFHKHLALSLDEMNNIPKKLKEKIEQTQDVYGVKPVDCRSEEHTSDSSHIEESRMPSSA